MWNWLRPKHKRPGVYRIRNTATGAFYIGGTTKTIEERLDRHRRDLVSGTHFKPRMQSDWDAYGSGAFVFEAIEATTGDDAFARELAWQRHCYDPDLSYYVLPIKYWPKKQIEPVLCYSLTHDDLRALEDAAYSEGMIAAFALFQERGYIPNGKLSGLKADLFSISGGRDLAPLNAAINAVIARIPPEPVAPPEPARVTPVAERATGAMFAPQFQRAPAPPAEEPAA